MTDRKKPEDLKDDDLDAAQGGMVSFGTEATTFRDKAKRDGAERFIGETEKNIVTSGGGSDI
jgi:hypothetical protein